MRSLRIATVSVALAVLATGCIKGKVDVKVDRDGSASIEMELALDPEFAEMGFASGDEELSPEELSSQLRADMEADLDDLPEGAQYAIDEIELDGWPGVRVVVTNIDVDDFPTLMADGGEGGDDFIGRDGDGWKFSMATSSLMTSADVPLDEELDGSTADGDGIEMDGFEEFAEDFAKMMFGDATMTWRVTMPGKVTDHEGGGKVSGSTVEWEVPIADPPERIAASWDGKAGGGGSSTVPLAIGGGVIAAVAAVLLWRRRGTTPPGGGTEPLPVGAPSGSPAGSPTGAPAGT